MSGEGERASRQNGLLEEVAGPEGNWRYRVMVGIAILIALAAWAVALGTFK